MINSLISPLPAVLNCAALAFLLLTSLFNTPSFAAEDWPLKQILCLHTERFPYTSGKKIFEKRHNTTIMSRELTRQAFVIAATQELGIPVRDQRGDLELAKTYFRRSLIGPQAHSLFSTLAGDRLCQMNDSGKSQPDKDKLDAETMWPPFEPNGMEQP